MNNNKNSYYKNLTFIFLFTFDFIDNFSIVYDNNFKLSFSMLMSIIDLYLVYFNVFDLLKTLKYNKSLD